MRDVGDRSAANELSDTDGVSTTARKLQWSSEFLVSGLLAGAGVALLLGSGNIRIPPTANVVDPRFFPRIVAALLLFAAIAHFVQVARGDFGQPDEGEDVDLSRPGDLVGLASVSASFIAHAILVDRVGWPISAVVLFAGSAIGLGARPMWRALLVGVSLSIGAFLLFRLGLGVYLPGGPFERLVETRS